MAENRPQWGSRQSPSRVSSTGQTGAPRCRDRLKVSEVVALFASFYPRSRDPLSVIREVGLAEKAGAWTSRLSGGPRQPPPPPLAPRGAPPGDLIAALEANLVVEVEMAAGDIGDEAVLQLVGVSSVRRENGAILVSIRDAHITVPALLDLFRARSVVLAPLTLRQAARGNGF